MKTPKKKTPVRRFDVFGRYVFYFVFGALVGWIYEMIYCPIVLGDPVFNRGFLLGPYLPIYGFGAVILMLILGRLLKKRLMVWKINLMPVVIFVAIFFITTAFEYFSHWLIDWYFIPNGLVEQNLWDYSDDWLNINGRVHFRASLNFAIIGIVAMYGVIPVYEKIVMGLRKGARDRIVVVILGVLGIDLVATVLLAVL